MNHNENGNVLFLILIAVALFAALSYAVTSSSRSGGQDASKDTTKINVLPLIQYGSSLQGGINRLLLSNGCTQEEISFENPSSTAAGQDYSNPLSPADNRCHLFHPNGGGIVFESPTIITKYKSSLDPVSQIHLISIRVPGVGTTAPDLVFAVYGGIALKSCAEINTRLGVNDNGSTKPEYGSDGDAHPFKGDFTNLSDMEFEPTDTYPTIFCAYDSEKSLPNESAFFQVLIQR